MQHVDDSRMLMQQRELERRLLFGGTRGRVADAWVRLRTEQSLHDVRLPRGRGVVQGRAEKRAVLQQRRDDRVVAHGRGHFDRERAVLRERVQVGPMPDQKLDELRVALRARKVEHGVTKGRGLEGQPES